MNVSITSSVAVVTLLLLTLCAGNNDSCDIESCLQLYNSLKGLLDNLDSDSPTHENVDDVRVSRVCPLHHDLSICIRSQSKLCRGNLYYHFVEKLVRDLGKRAVKHNCTGSSGRGGERGSHHRNTSRHSPSRHKFEDMEGKCAAKLPATVPMVGCALYGVTNLKGFSDPFNHTNIPYCSIPGTWSLMETREFVIQLTSKSGFNPMPKDTTTITLVTVIIRPNDCSARKTYQATFEEVPHMFNDGTTTAKNVYIETIKESEHIKIHLPYLQTVIDIYKLIGHLPLPSLSITIRMPAVNVSNLLEDPSQIRGLPLCFFGCPKTASIRPRSIDHSTHHCPSSADPVESESSENSISSAVCDSLHAVKKILGNVSVLEQRLTFPGEENFTTAETAADSDIYSKSKQFLSHIDRYAASAENSALTSHSVGTLRYFSCHICVFIYFSVISLSHCLS